MTVIPMRDELMVQQQINGPWQHMVGVIMLNQTSRKQVKKVLPEFLNRWDTAEKLLKADEDSIRSVISPLGMTNVRLKRLLRMSSDYLYWDRINAKDLYGIGKYGSDSYEIFFKHNYSVQPSDKELIRYLEDREKGQLTMDVITVIVIIAFCAVASAFLYGMWVLEDDRYQFRKKHGIDPKYHGWVVKDKEENDTDKDQ